MNRNQIIENMIALCQSIIDKLLKLKVMTPSEILYNVAYEHLGEPRQSNPNNIPKVVGCVDHFEEIHFKAFSEYLGGQRLAHTAEAKYALDHSPQYKPLTFPKKGCIRVTVTEGTKHGHIGVEGKTHIMSNNSFTGKWEADFTPESWERYYGEKGLGLKTYFYERIELSPPKADWGYNRRLSSAYEI